MSLKALLLLLSIAATTLVTAQQGVGINTTTPDPSAALDINSTDKGLLVPRMTTAQRNAIVNPATGLIVLNLDDKCVDIYNGTTWIKNCGFTITQDTLAAAWTQRADFGGINGRYAAVGFSIGSKGYIGTGIDVAIKKDFWEYDPATNAWSQKADVGGPARYYAAGFSIGAMGYIGTGANGSTEIKDFWEYNPATNTWTQKADFGGSTRSAGIGIGTATRGYIGLGANNTGLKQDFWEYNPGTNTWTSIGNFGGTARLYATGFSTGQKLYAGTGNDGAYKKDFWEYDPGTSSWTQKADFGGIARHLAVGFGMAGKGYIGTGTDGTFRKDFWEYDPVGNAWTQIANLPGVARGQAVGFAIGTKGFVGTGVDGSSVKRDFWEYNALNIVTNYNNSAAANYTNNYFVNDGLWSKRGDTLVNTNVLPNMTVNAGRIDLKAPTRITDHLIFNSSNGAINYSNAGNLYFRSNTTTGDNTNYTDRMVITNSGNVGIGVSSPSATLDVSGTMRLNLSGALSGRVLTSGSSGEATWQAVPRQIELGLATGQVAYWDGGIWRGTSNIHNHFNGNVGIGTTSPGKKLDVNGIIRLNTHLIFNSTHGIINWSGGGNLYFRTNNPTGEEGTYSEMMVLTGQGWLGIGTTTPASRLDITGSLRMNDGTQGVGKVLTSNATGLASWQTLPTQITNGSATGNTLYWTGSAWANSANVFNNNANVGIGTATPAAKLDVAGTLKVTDGTQAAGKVLTSDADGLASWQTIPTQITNGLATGNTLYWDGSTWSNSSNLYNNNGNVGIGTATPAAKLDVTGTLKVTDGTEAAGKVLTSDAAGLASWQTVPTQIADGSAAGNTIFWDGSAWHNNGNIFNSTATGFVGIGTSSPGRKLDVNGPVRMNTHLIFNSSNGVLNYPGAGSLYFRSNSVQGDDATYTERMILTGAGNLGIGTVSPVNKLSVVGNANVTGNLGIGAGAVTPSTALDVDGGIRTRYSGTSTGGFASTAMQTINIGIVALPAGWDFANTVVLISNADGAGATIHQARLSSLTNIQVLCTPVATGTARFNWIVFKL